MLIAALLVLAYGPLNWSFPWWAWVLGVAWQASENLLQVEMIRKPKPSRRHPLG